MWVTNFDYPLRTLGTVLGRFKHESLYATTHEHMLYGTSIDWCVKVYRGVVANHDQGKVP